LVAPDGTRRTMVLDDATDGKMGWVVAPEAAAHDLCIVQEEVVYSTVPSQHPSAINVLSARAGDLFPVNGIEHAFVPPPATAETNGGTVTKTVLRGYVCSELEGRRLVPYRDRSAPPPAAR